MKRFASLVAFAAASAIAPRALADIDQGDQIMFGVMGTYVPHQNNLPADVAAIGHYVSFAHHFDFVVVGVRVALSYGWLPSGAPGQQYLLEPDVLLGVRGKIGKLTLLASVASGPLMNGGEGFSQTTVNRTSLRGAAQWTIVKQVTIEAFAGPAFTIGASAVGTLAEFGLGCGWNL